MISNLPKSVSIEKFKCFDFGSAEASEDELLGECPCAIKPIREFLLGNKEIAIGERGSGKSALFRLIKEGAVHFDNPLNKEQVIIPLDDELDYKDLKSRISTAIPDGVLDEETKFRAIWEVYILYRLTYDLHIKFSDDPDLDSILSELQNQLGIKKKRASFKDILLAHKKTIGVKFEGLHANLMIPNFYAQTEPSANKQSHEEENNIIINLDPIKHLLSAFLRKKNAVVIVMLDKLDEFVVKEEYETQKSLIQGLLYCQRGYTKYPGIKIKLFLRSDLFDRLDYSGLGFDKIISKTVKLVWSEEEIREFIARRIFYNLTSCLGLESLKFSVDEQRLYLNKEALRDGPIVGESLIYKRGILYPLKKAYWNLRAKLAILGIDSRDTRKTNFNDEINKQILTSLFPRLPYHHDKNQNKKQIDLFEYLGSHFSLGSGCATPRHILMYLQGCMEHSLDYHEKNIDKDYIKVDDNGEYPFVMRDCMLTAYQEFQDRIWSTISHIDKQYKKAILQIKENRKELSGNIASAQRIAKLIEKHINDHGELIRFLAFSTHIGLFRITNHQTDSLERQYQLPILLQ